MLLINEIGYLRFFLLNSDEIELRIQLKMNYRLHSPLSSFLLRKVRVLIHSNQGFATKGLKGYFGVQSPL